MMHNLIFVQISENDSQKKANKVLEEFDTQFKSLVEVATMNTQAEYDANLFRKVCNNGKNNLGKLDACIKELRMCVPEGKELYEKYALSN